MAGNKPRLTANFGGRERVSLESRYDYDFIDYDLWLALDFRFFFARCYFYISKISLLIWQMMFYRKTTEEKYGRYISENFSILIPFYGYKLVLQCDIVENENSLLEVWRRFLTPTLSNDRFQNVI